ncbi:hypothetical protein PAECIP112173_02785 [Paenibacillus sp. JJ-100]|uniref:rhamnogalacturonan lyase B N-terminal domain-containing protein n=1 Tax=Paenibacillus sp. JJ-100 TaxID=2974896 RepID=UPI0022FF9B5E|nr:rhamnogalacturonan lyase B N-terminal domain-containing protein [Paenibacillus sp. JJ-100]CAI6080107.1 hypothetical protein PAECIP112173_02785 [Paenibacillus sp. JJ-100]
MTRHWAKKGLSMLLLIVMAASVFAFPTSTSNAAAIQVIDSGSRIEVNTGSGLVYIVNKANGDIISAKLNGTELNSSRGSHISSGLGSSANVTWSKSSSGSTVLITVSTTTLTHYYASRSGENMIYMATHITAQPSIGELRYIFRGNGSVLTGVPVNSNLRGNTGFIESEDVFGFANGQSASKYYGNDQAKDLSVRGVTGNGVGVFMAYGSREKSSGGPFFRDIQFQSGSETEVYNYMNSRHAQTENWRLGLHGPYALIFTTGGTPPVPDFGWMSELNLKGWVASRGNVVLNGLSGMETGFEYTIGFANSNAQYWVNASSSGAATKNDMIPGTYTMTVYKGELAVYTENVNVNAAQTTTVNTRAITNDPGKASSIWRIGNWDGTPREFLNGQTIPVRHPSDSRNPSWGPVTYVPGSATNRFPAIQFRGENSPTTVNFNLNATQSASSHVLNIGITAAYNNGRPSVAINGRTLSNPAPSSQPDSRSLTIGTYRGNNTTFSWNIPASYFVNGANTITITPISGSSDLGNWLSAGWVYDCVELLN